MTTCKKSCCWTPYSCARQRQCGCHTGHQPIMNRVSQLELERATALTTKKRNHK